MGTPTAPRPDTAAGPDGRGPLLLKIGLPLAVVAGLSVVDFAAMRAVVMATVGSGQARLIVAGVIALTLGWSVILRRFVPNPWAQSGLVLLPLIVMFGLYVAPYFGGDTVVDDEFPVALAAAPAEAEPDVVEEGPAAIAPPVAPAPTVAAAEEAADPIWAPSRGTWATRTTTSPLTST